jgi:DNA repair exonuclease SbcCD ATPase subunit
MTDWKTRAMRIMVGKGGRVIRALPADTVTVEEADAFMAGAEACINDWRKAWDKLLAEKKEAEAKLAGQAAAYNVLAERLSANVDDLKAKLAVYKGYFLGNPMTEESFEEWKRLKKPSYEELEAKLAAAHKALEENLEQQNERGSVLATRIAALEAARDKALETAEEFRAERDKARADKGCFAGPDGGDCPWLNDRNAKRRRPNAR